VRAFDRTVREGKVREVAASNVPPDRLVQSLEIAEREGLAAYTWLQPHYNLVERAGYERDYAPIVAERGLKVAPYYALASGFLTGKYRDGADVDSPRAQGARKYLDDRGRAVLDALDQVAAAHGAEVASVAIAWLAAQPGITSPIASARTVEQLGPVLAAVELQLTAGELALLDEVSA